MQNQFRQQYSKIGNTREQLFHAWTSFHFNENTETLDSYVTCIRQVVTLLGYSKPQVLSIFENTLSTRLYWVLFPIKDLRQAIETAKRTLTKEKIHGQKVGQSSSMPFINIKDGYTSEKVTFDTQDALEEKIDRLMSMMSKLTTQDDSHNKQFKPKIYQGKRRGQTRNFYDRHIYDQRNYQNRHRSKSGDRRISFSDRIQYGQNYRDSPRYNQNDRNDFRRGNFRGNLR